MVKIKPCTTTVRSHRPGAAWEHQRASRTTEVIGAWDQLLTHTRKLWDQGAGLESARSTCNAPAGALVETLGLHLSL